MWKNDYRLCRYSLSRNEIEVLTNERIDCFNVGYGYVYYQVNGEEACLKCMRDDGSDSWVIAEGQLYRHQYDIPVCLFPDVRR